MATTTEMRALLAVACPWCNAKPGEKCVTRRGKTLVPITTLDGESHDMRWQAATGRGAGVIQEAEVLRQRRALAAKAKGSLAAAAKVPRPW